MRTPPRGSYIWILGPQLVELFQKHWKVWPCWRRCVTKGRLYHPQWVLSLSCACRLSCELTAAAQEYVFLPAAILLTTMVMDSNPLEQGAKLNVSFYKLPWSWCFVTAIERLPRCLSFSRTVGSVYISSHTNCDLSQPQAGWPRPCPCHKVASPLGWNFLRQRKPVCPAASLPLPKFLLGAMPCWAASSAF